MDQALQQLARPDARPRIRRPRLYLNKVEPGDQLFAFEFGEVQDGRRPDDWHVVSESFSYLHDGATGPVLGFAVRELAEIDPYDSELEEIWGEPFFDVPLLGLAGVSAGEIVLAAKAYFDGEETVNQAFFSVATHETGEAALVHWRNCLQAGDSMAHFALGYTHFELGHFRDAYRHLRYYLEISPAEPWNWCWFGKAAAAVGEIGEARFAFEHAIELSEAGWDETDAPELLAELEGESA